MAWISRLPRRCVDYGSANCNEESGSDLASAEGSTLWGGAVYTSVYGACTTLLPSGDRFANPITLCALGRSGFQQASDSVLIRCCVRLAPSERNLRAAPHGIERCTPQ
ncbi:hypothetical protein DPX16_6078 [Anabarilius grahami]|uniref:Uncharacterized protein n=1 Tax=Anabarilius grahami TaxID=495550 RepID=A0A3N0Z1P1_ANAGA|nr:hypothetical protein DPX16_6078 [Anabarilius grahami]